MSLGKYEAEVRDALFNRKSISSLIGFEVLVSRYRSRVITDPSGLYCLPRALHPYKIFGFSLAGFRITVKLDPHRFSPEDQRNVLNGRNVLRGDVIEFENTPEGHEAHEMVVAARQRRKK